MLLILARTKSYFLSLRNQRSHHLAVCCVGKTFAYYIRSSVYSVLYWIHNQPISQMTRSKYIIYITLSQTIWGTSSVRFLWCFYVLRWIIWWFWKWRLTWSWDEFTFNFRSMGKPSVNNDEIRIHVLLCFHKLGDFTIATFYPLEPNTEKLFNVMI